MTEIDIAAAGCSGDILDVKTDQTHVAVLTSSGDVCTAGYNARGELGRGSPGTNMAFGKAALPSGVKAKSIYVTSMGQYNSSRPNNTYVVTEDGSVYGAGSNYYGQLGDGTKTNRSTFRKMQVFGPNERANFVLSGYGTTVIYTLSGRIYTVGNNGNGQLGDGTTNDSSTPRANRYVNIIKPQIF